MVTVLLYGLLRTEFGKDRLAVQAGTLREIIAQIEGSGANEKLLRSCVMFVNNRPLKGINRLNVRLQEGDELALLPPASGG